MKGLNSPRRSRSTPSRAAASSIPRTRAGLWVIAALRPTATLVTTPMAPLPRISSDSFTSWSSPETTDTDTPCSPATRALIPTSLSQVPFTRKSEKA